MLSTVRAAWPNQLFEDPTTGAAHRVLLDINTRTPSPLGDLALHRSTGRSAQMLRQSLSESRTAFLQQCHAPEDPPPAKHAYAGQHAPGECGARRRKISFKVKSALTPSKRTATTTLSANKVHQLTQKFNELVGEEPKIARAARRANSIRAKELGGSGDAPPKRPSIRPKPPKLEDRRPTDARKKPAVRRRVSVKRFRSQPDAGAADGKMCVRTKIRYLEAPQTVRRQDSVGAAKDEVDGSRCATLAVDEGDDASKNVGVGKLQSEPAEDEQTRKHSEQTNQTNRQEQISDKPVGTEEPLPISDPSLEQTINDQVAGSASTKRVKHAPTLLKAPAGSVKAAIEIFERRKSTSAVAEICKTAKLEKQSSLDQITKLNVTVAKIPRSKPQVPEKSVTKPKGLVSRTLRNVARSVDHDKNITELQNYFATKSAARDDESPAGQPDVSTEPAIQHEKEAVRTDTKSARRNIFKHDEPTQQSSVLHSARPSADEDPTGTTDLSSSACEDTVLEVKHIPHVHEPSKAPAELGSPSRMAHGAEKSARSGLYDGLRITKTTPPGQLLRMAVPPDQASVRPNNSFLWRTKSRDSTYFNTYTKSFYADTGQAELQYDVPKCSTEVLNARRTEGTTVDLDEDIYDTIKNVSSAQVVEGSVDEKNFEDLYDTVDPRPTGPSGTNGDVCMVEEILAKADEIIKQYNKCPQPAPSGPDDEHWLDDVSMHSYESFYNSNYEEMESHYEYPKTVVRSTKSDASEGIYETLSVRTTPEKRAPEGGSSPNPCQKPLPRLPHEEAGPNRNVYQKLAKDAPARIHQTPLPRLPDAGPTEDQPARAPVQVTRKPLPLVPTAQFYRDEAEEDREENVYSTLALPPAIGVRAPSPEYVRPVAASDCYEPVHAVNRRILLHRPTVDGSLLPAHGYESVRPGDAGRLSPYAAATSAFRRDGASSGSSGSNRGSVISCDQQSNSLYGKCGWDGTAPAATSSEISCSDRSDDWEDMSDPEMDEDDKAEQGFVIIRERQRSKKNAGWSNKVRDQWTKSPRKMVILQDEASSDPNHYYESLHSDEDFDSFDSESDEDSFGTANQNDSGVDMGLAHLPDPPGTNAGNVYGLTRLAASANRHMQRLRSNWSSTKLDITKSLSRMTGKRAGARLPASPAPSPPPQPPPLPKDYERVARAPKLPPAPVLPPSLCATTAADGAKPYQNVEYRGGTVGRRKHWLKFRRSSSLAEPSADDGLTKSTFYLTSEVHVDTSESRPVSAAVEEKPVVPARRRSRPSSNQRPASPPPPAPVSPANQAQATERSPASKAQKARSTSWYAECGLFKGGAQSPTVSLPPLPSSAPPTGPPANTTCWYAEVGLYQKNGSTPSSSSAENSSGSQYPRHYQQHYQQAKQQQQDAARTDEQVENSYYNGEFPGGGDTLRRHQSADMQLLLRDEPLYQFYDAAVAECACQENSSDSDYDGYEEIGGRTEHCPSPQQQQSPPTKPSVKQLVSPVRNGSGALVSRTLWCEIPEIIQSEILCTLSAAQRKLQEAKFEIITSEASYLNSLTVLEEHFVAALDADALLDAGDRAILFGNVAPVRQCSERLLADLEACWQDSVLLHGVCELVRQHALAHFHVYVRYCENQVHSDAALKRCRERRPAFAEALRAVELRPACQALSLHSFLMLPMQRITRMPLLVDAVLKRLTPADDEYQACQLALASVNDVVMRCNEGARQVEQQVETARVARALEFPAHVPPVQLAGPVRRHLVRSGELTQLLGRNDEVKLTFGRRFAKVQLTLFLFDDVLLVTRRKSGSTATSEDSYTVLHHCPRNFVELGVSTPADALPAKDAHGKHLLFLTLLENQEHKTVELLLSCASETDRERWLAALSPPVSENPYERVYESWDCPQVRAVHAYQASQPDDLALARGDVVNVRQKTGDGWYCGERMRDGVTGWFPANHTVEIANPHVRARNLKQRYRLLAFTGSYLNKTANNNSSGSSSSSK